MYKHAYIDVDVCTYIQTYMIYICMYVYMPTLGTLEALMYFTHDRYLYMYKHECINVYVCTCIHVYTQI